MPKRMPKKQPYFPDDYLKIWLAIQVQIDLATESLASLKQSLSPPKLPDGCYIAKYQAEDVRTGAFYPYYNLGHKDKIFPQTREKNKGKFKEKVHLGHEYNPRYRDAHLGLAEAKIHYAQLEAIQALEIHIDEMRLNLSEITYWLTIEEKHIRWQLRTKTEEDEKGKRFWEFIYSCMNYKPYDFVADP